MNGARAFLAGMIDYAGLFPPASLSMSDAVSEYARQLSGKDSDLIGRFVVGAGRLDELSAAASDVLPHDGEPWRLSVVTPDVEGSSRSLAFNQAHRGPGKGHAVCEAIEISATDESGVTRVLGEVDESFQLFIELPLDADPEPLVAALAGTRASAKARTGGVVPGSVPSARNLLRFVRACATHGVPFKATAGLHHAVRGRYPLTYEEASATEMMFGYLNVFLAAAFCRAGTLTDSELLELLEESEPTAFTFGAAGMGWRASFMSWDDLTRARAGFALSFGSCSFSEPVAEARELGLIS